MRMSGYTEDELQTFYRVIDQVVTELAERELQLPIHELLRRLFEAADRGERDPDRLRIEILRDLVIQRRPTWTAA